MVKKNVKIKISGFKCKKCRKDIPLSRYKIERLTPKEYCNTCDTSRPKSYTCQFCKQEGLSSKYRSLLRHKAECKKRIQGKDITLQKSELTISSNLHTLFNTLSISFLL